MILTKTLNIHLQIIYLSASENKLSDIKQQAEEYAALLMEELDLYHLGYITVNNSLINNLKNVKWNTEIWFDEHGVSYRWSEKTCFTSIKSISCKSKALAKYWAINLSAHTQIDNPLMRCYHSTSYLLLDNWQRV